MARQRILQMGIVMVLMGGSLSATASSVSISIGEKGIRFSVSNNDHHVFMKHAYPMHGRDIRHRNLKLHTDSKSAPIPLQCRPMITQPHPSRTVIIWISNSNRSRTRIVLTRTPYGYRGPQGEYYNHLPTHRQLQRMYGF